MFQHQKFEVEDTNCALKVDTDAVLLVETTALSRAPNTTQIDAVVIDQAASKQAELLIIRPNVSPPNSLNFFYLGVPLRVGLRLPLFGAG